MTNKWENNYSCRGLLQGGRGLSPTVSSQAQRSALGRQAPRLLGFEGHLGPWCWEGLGAGGEGEDRGWDGWMASPTQWAWVWVNSGSWWWTGRPGMLQFMGSQRVGHNWATELNWTEGLLSGEPEDCVRGSTFRGSSNTLTAWYKEPTH